MNKKKLWYALGVLFVIAILVSVSIFMFSDKLPPWIVEKKSVIVSAIITYGSAALFFAKVVSFIAIEIGRKRFSTNEKIEKFLTKDLEITKEKIVKEKEKDMISIKELSNVYKIGKYKFTLNDKKGIHISWEGEFDYKEFVYANGEFIERLRKISDKDC